MYAVPVESSLLRSWNTVLPLQLPGRSSSGEKAVSVLKVPHAVSKCTGTNGVHDVHLAQLPRDAYEELSEPLVIFEFDFGKRGQLLKRRR
jgi:hypothetical protein